MNKGKKKG